MSLKNRIGGAWNALFGVNVSPSSFPNALPVNQSVSWIDNKFENYIKEGYAANDVVYSICQIASEKIKVAPWAAYKIKDERSLKQMVSLQRENKAENNKRILDLQTKALEVYTGDGKLNELLQYPNETESFPDLVANSSIAKMLTGNRYLQGVLLDGGANAGKPQEIHLLPSHLVGIINNKAFPFRTLSYEMQLGVQRIPFLKEEVMHDKYFNPQVSPDGAHLYGMSPLKAALKTLTNDNSSLEASTKSFQNMGPGGVLYLNDERMTGDQAVEQAGAVKKKWMEEYSGPANAKKIVVSGYKVGWEEMGLSPVDLMIIEQQKWNLIRFCNIWNFPHLLLTSDHATDNNVGWAEKALTQRCALPLLTSFRDNFNRKLHQDWGFKDKNIYIDYDQSVFSELETNRKEATDWIKDSPHLSIRQRYELQNLEIPEAVLEKYGDMLDVIYVANGTTPLEDVTMGDIENNLNKAGYVS